MNYSLVTLRKFAANYKNSRDNLLKFVEIIDEQLEHAATEFDQDISLIRQVFELQAVSYESEDRWKIEEALRKQLRLLFYPIQRKVQNIIADTVRASSVVENINSRLRPYFFLRKSFGNESLQLLRFFLNHKSFMRSAHKERINSH